MDHRTTTTLLPGDTRNTVSDKQAVSPNELLTAFGQTRTLEEWARDPRCRVGRGGLRRRLQRGWTPEDAILVPRGELPPPPKERRWKPLPGSIPLPKFVPASRLALAPAWIVTKGARPLSGNSYHLVAAVTTPVARERKKTNVDASSESDCLKRSLRVPDDAELYVVDLVRSEDIDPQSLLLLTELRNHCSERAIGLSILAEEGGIRHLLLQMMGLDQSIPIRFTLLDAFQAARGDRTLALQRHRIMSQSLATRCSRRSLPDQSPVRVPSGGREVGAG